MTIRLSQLEVDLLTRLQLWPTDVADRIVRRGKDTTLEISDDDALELRKRVADRLMISGFDENYEPTADGRLMEALIDKLHTA